MKNWKRFIPLIVLLVIIFGLTVQNCASSEAMTIAVQDVIKQVTNTSQETSYWWNDYVLMRRLAHIVEYLLLGLCSMYGFRCWWKAGMLCVGASLADELVKGMLPGREFDLVDMGFDVIGYAVGIGIMYLIFRIKGESIEKMLKDN